MGWSRAFKVAKSTGGKRGSHRLSPSRGRTPRKFPVWGFSKKARKSTQWIMTRHDLIHVLLMSCSESHARVGIELLTRQQDINFIKVTSLARECFMIPVKRPRGIYTRKNTCKVESFKKFMSCCLVNLASLTPTRVTPLHHQQDKTLHHVLTLVLLAIPYNPYGFKTPKILQ